MKTNHILLGLGAVAVIGTIVYYNKSKKTEALKSIASNTVTEGTPIDSVNTPASLPDSVISNEPKSGITAEGEKCVTTCESTPRNPNQSPTVYSGECTANLANQPYGGFHTITRCGTAAISTPVRNPYINQSARYVSALNF